MRDDCCNCVLNPVRDAMGPKGIENQYVAFQRRPVSLAMGPACGWVKSGTELFKKALVVKEDAFTTHLDKPFHDGDSEVCLASARIARK